MALFGASPDDGLADVRHHTPRSRHTSPRVFHVKRHGTEEGSCRCDLGVTSDDVAAREEPDTAALLEGRRGEDRGFAAWLQPPAKGRASP